MDNINLSNYVAVYLTHDDEDGEIVAWKRADQPHPNYAIYLSWVDGFKVRKYYEYLITQNQAYLIDGPLEFLRNIGDDGNNSHDGQSERIVALHIDEQNHHIVKSPIIDDNDVVVLAREYLADALIDACSLDLEVYFVFHNFIKQFVMVVFGVQS